MIAKDWLEDIKERFAKYEHDYNLNGEDIEWLIQQAERVEELEQVIGDLDENVAAFETLWLEEKRKNKHYKQALEFYAERDNYQWEVSYRPQQEIDCMVIDDSGHTARKALEGDND
jgi:hypothetical protein